MNKNESKYLGNETYAEFLLRHKLRNEEILVKYRAGASQKALAKEYKLSTVRVHMIISKELRKKV